MNLRHRLILLLVPIIILPLLFVGIFSEIAIEHVTSEMSLRIAQLLMLGFIIGLGVIVVAMVVALARAISAPLRRLSGVAQHITDGKFMEVVCDTHQVREIAQLEIAVARMQGEIQRQQTIIQTEAAHVAMGQMASQVVHDIAGPLASIRAAVGFLQQMTASDARWVKASNLLDLGLKRLSAISADLIEQQRDDESVRGFSVHELLDELVGEYAMHDRGCLEIVKQYHTEAIWMYGGRVKLQRALGNLIKNAVEAMDYVGTLTLRTTRTAEGVAIVCEDTGNGMPPEVLARILQEGGTYGKADGHGIGLSVVRRMVQEFGGRLAVQSQEFVGTTFRIDLPASVFEAPVGHEPHEADVFVVEIHAGRLLVVIDDDPSLAETWRLHAEAAGWSVLTCASYEEFLQHDCDPERVAGVVVDYHFDNSELTGAQIIELLQSHGYARLYLCTAEYWKPSVKAQAQSLNVTICPKPLPRIVFQSATDGTLLPTDPAPVTHATSPCRVLVIDDDEGIRFSWEIEQEKLGITHLHAFASMEEFLASQFDVRDIDIAFVDKHVEGSAWKLLDTVRDLKARGIPRVIIASGESPTELRQSIEAKFADGVASPKIPESLVPHLEAPVRLRIVE